jgi:histidinol-phosphate/aromatic aminotransferase/cobyric acid decarboxylase-like protein
MNIDSLRNRHGGYWRFPHLDFHYLFNHYFPPPELYAELQEAVLTLANSYPSGQQVLAELLAGWKDDRWFTADNLVVGNGSSELIKLLNDRVMTRTTVPLPTFNEFTVRAGPDIHRYALSEGDRFTLDVDRLIDEVRRSRSEWAVIVNPNNPVGNLVDVNGVRRVLESGVQLVIDEAFMAFANLVIVTSTTKSVGIAGLRLGYILTSNARVKRQLRDALPIWNVNALAEYVIEAFPRYRIEHRASLDRIRADTRWFSNALHDIPYLEPCPTPANGRRLAEILFDRHGFVVKDGIRQAELTTAASYVRLGVRNRTDNEKLLAALGAMDVDEIRDPCVSAVARGDRGN